MLRKMTRPLLSSIRALQPKFAPNFCSQKISRPMLMDEMHNMAESIPASVSQEDYSELAMKYVELTEESFIEFAAQSNANPQMLLLLEKVLAYKPTSKPRLPHPKPLEGIESVLVILSELYSCDSLI